MQFYIFVLFLIFAKTSQAITIDDIVKFVQKAYEVLDGITKIIPLPENAGKNISELAALYKYQLEAHSVVTHDGYKLTVFRVPQGRHEAINENGKKPVVLLMHGLMSTAADWLNLGPNRSLGYILADAGYDVWLGNARGNKYSRAHTSLDPDKNESFWEFSWHEQGIYDLPATIDYILNNTGVTKLSYVGHSEGTTDFFVMGAEKPDYNDKISLSVSLAPSAYMTNMSSPIIRYIDYNFLDILTLAESVLGIYEFPSSDWIRIIGEILCSDESGLQFLCIDILGLLVGFDNKELNATLLPVILTNYPGGASTRQLTHYGQEIKSGKFRQYDFGISNLVKYGSLSPPNYNISAIRAPMALFYSENDFMIATSNVEQLAQQLPHVVSNILLPYKLFSHFDYLWANDVKTILYDGILDLLAKYKTL